MILKTFGLSKTYPSGGGVKNIDMEVNSGDFILLSGRNGAGKSTLIRLLALVEPPDKGHILLKEFSTLTLKPDKYHLWRRLLGVIPQDLMLLPERTVMQNVTLSLRAVGFSGNNAKKLALKMLARVGLSHKIHSKVLSLSGGEARRTAIARALCNEPFLLLADEPLGDLDPNSAQEIMGLFERINQMGAAVLLVTHRQDVRPKCRYTEMVMEEGMVRK